MTAVARRLDTRFGTLTVVVDPEAVGDRPAPAPGAVVESGYNLEVDDGIVLAPGIDPLLDFVAAAVADWDRGTDPAGLDRVPVQTGGGFRGRVRHELRSVGSGETITYGDLAARAGNSRAARAAGSACAANPVAPFVPCHRVVPASGSIGHYGFGPGMKESMLRHEGALP